MKNLLTIVTIALLSTSLFAQQTINLPSPASDNVTNASNQSQASTDNVAASSHAVENSVKSAGVVLGIVAGAVVIVFAAKLISKISSGGSADSAADGAGIEIEELTKALNDSGMKVSVDQVSEAVLKVLDENLDNNAIWDGNNVNSPELFAQLIIGKLI